MQSILLVLTPIIVSGLTQLSKWIVPYLARVNNKWIVLGVLVLSYLGAIGNAALTGQPVEAASVSTLADTLVNLLGATGVYFFGTKFIGSK
jgi:hypothetical protein